MANDQTPGPTDASAEFVVRAGPDLWRNIGKWTVAFLFFCALTALMISLHLFQATAEGSAKRTIRRSVAALTEIDPLIDRNYDDLQQRAASAGPDDTVELRDFPIAVPLARDDARGASKEQLRDLLLDRSADLMYTRGTEPLRDGAHAGDDVGGFSAAGLTDGGLGFLRSRNHDILAVLTFVLAALCVVLGLTLAALCRGFGRLASVGAVVLVASAPLLILGIGARFYMRIVTNEDTEYIQREFLRIGQGLAWIPIRDGIAFTLLGLILLGLGVALAVWADRRQASRHSAARPLAR
jgi:hypothetical protein